MHEIKQLRQLVEEQLRNIDFPVHPASLYDPIKYMLDIGGKRMRPLLLLMGCDALNGDIYKAIYPAVGLEVFHNFTLLHDDLMDNAPLRRTKQTVHTKWNPNIAILSGDAMFVKACQLVMQTDDIHIRPLLEIFNKTALEVCEGQQYDMDFETSTNVSLHDYLQMIERKTAVLLGCSLKMGAIIANASDEDAEHLYETGRNLGMAFQIQDDLLDLYGSEDQFGKMPGGDIVANKKTFLMLKAMELANEKQQSTLLNIFSDKSINDTERVQNVKAVFDSLNIKTHAEEAIDHFYSIAMNEWSKLDVDEKNKQPLTNLAHSLRMRVA